MKTITTTLTQFESLEELFIATKGHQLTAQEIINKRTYVNGNWETFTTSLEFDDEVCPLIASALGGHSKTQKQVESTLRYSRPQHWGLNRIFFDKYNSRPVSASYCAGQDGQVETAQIRKFLKR